jgi:hypothetical protein
MERLHTHHGISADLRRELPHCTASVKGSFSK